MTPIDKFDPGLGTLTEVTVSFDVLGVMQIAGNNPNPMTSPADFFLVETDSQIGNFLNVKLRGRGVLTFLPSSGGTSLFETEGVGFAFVTGAGLVKLNHPIFLDWFTATSSSEETVQLPMDMTEVISPQRPITTVVSDIRGVLEVSYLFDEPASNSLSAPNATVPEPASVAVFAVIGLGMTQIRRRKVRG